MAGLLIAASAGEASITSTPKTVIGIKAPANQRVTIKGLEIFGKGTSNTDTPVKCELITAANLASGTAGSGVTSVQDTEMGETPQSTYTYNYSAEPTYTTAVVVRTWEVHPQTGLVVYFPLHDEIRLKGGTAFGLRLTSNQNETMACQVLAEE